MVDNLAEKVVCPLSRGRYVLFAYNWDWDCEKCPLYGVAGCPLFRGFIEVYGETIGTFRIVRYIVGVRC